MLLLSSPLNNCAWDDEVVREHPFLAQLGPLNNELNEWVMHPGDASH